MGKKSVILKKLNPILAEADDLKKKKKYKEAVRKYREGINFLRLKGTGMEGREIEVSKITLQIDHAHSANINDIKDEAKYLIEEKKFDKAIELFNSAFSVSELISDLDLKNKETENIKQEIRQTELKILIEQGIQNKEENDLEGALTTLKKCLKDAKVIYSSEPENKEILKIKDLTDQTYLEQIKLLTEKGKQSKNDSNLKNAMEQYENALLLIGDIHNSDLKYSEASKLEESINQIYSDQIKPILKFGKELIEKNIPKDAIKEFKKAEDLAKKMFELDQKKVELAKIGDLVNPLYLDKINPIKEKGLELIKKEKYEESTLLVNEASETFRKAYEIVNNMVESNSKTNELNEVTKLINDTCLAGIQVKEKKIHQLIDEKMFEEAISEMYSALSVAKHMTYEDADNKENDKIKNLVNHIYSAQIKDFIKNGSECLVQKQYDEARNIFNEAMKITNKMYLSEEMDSQVSLIKHLMYQSEMKQVVADGYISKEIKKFQEELDVLKERLVRANTVQDSKLRYQQMDDIKHQIDSVYSEQIKLYVEQGDQFIEQSNLDSANEQIENALKIIQFIEYPIMKDNQFINIVKSLSEYGNKLAEEDRFEQAFEYLDKALDVVDNIANNNNKSEEISKIILIYEQKLNNKAKQEIDKGRYDNAISDCNKAIELDDKFADSYYNIGLAYSNKKEFDKAIDNYKKTVKLNDNYIDAWNEQGLIYDLKDEYEEAIKSFKKTLDIDSDFAIGWYNLGNVYKRKNNLSEAIDCYRRVVNINPDFAKAWLFLGCNYFEQKEYYKAIEYIEKAIKLESEIEKDISLLINDLNSLLNSIQEKLSEMFKNK